MKQRGMTLIEVLVAMSLLAILALLGYRAFSGVLNSREQLLAQSERWSAQARAWQRIETDLARLAPGQLVTQVRLGPQPGGQRLTLDTFSAASPGGREQILLETRADGLYWARHDPASSDAPQFLQLLAAQQARWQLRQPDGQLLASFPRDSFHGPLLLQFSYHLTGLNGPLTRLWSLP